MPISESCDSPRSGSPHTQILEGAYITYQIQEGTLLFIINTTTIPFERFLENKVDFSDTDVLDSKVESILIRK